MNAIKTFLTKVERMTSTRSKELRLTYDEAHLLSVELANLLARKLEEADQQDTRLVIRGTPLKPAERE